MGTNPFHPDTDNDGVLDRVEIITGFDPLNPSPVEKIVYESPKKNNKAPINEQYKVERIEMIKEVTGNIKIEGRGLPNSFVNIYIYSEPFLVLVTKTDDRGRFVYILDKPLKKGPHQIYVAITDNKGKIMERSEVFNFIQLETAVAAILPPYLPEEIVSPTEKLSRFFTLLVIILICCGLLGGFLIISTFFRQGKKFYV